MSNNDGAFGLEPPPPGDPRTQTWDLLSRYAPPQRNGRNYRFRARKTLSRCSNCFSSEEYEYGRFTGTAVVASPD